MVYHHVLWNTGRNALEGLRDGDADLLLNLLTNDGFGRPDFQKGLWLSGNGMPAILDNGNRPNSQTLLHTFAGAQLLFNGLPLLYHPTLKSERFRRVTDDRFFLVIESRDPKFYRSKTEDFLTSLGPISIEALEA